MTIGRCAPRATRPNNTNLLLCLLVASFRTSISLHIPNTTWTTTWRRVLGDHR